MLNMVKRLTVYAKNLPELREKEKQIAKDLEDNILTDGAIKKHTLNKLFERYMSTRELKESTRANYLKTWENRVKDEIGNIKVVQILPSHIKSFYSKLSKAGYAYSTIKFINNMIYPALEMAVDDDIIRKNPAKFSISDYGRQAEERIALTVLQQEKMLEFVKNNQVYNTYYPMLRIMLGTGVRCGELIGLTWEDVDVRTKAVSIDHQLIYKDLGDGYKFHISTPKTDSGIRTIPMTSDVQRAFEEQKKLNFMLQKGKDVEIDGYKGFIFMAKSGRPLMPNAINNILYNIVDAYNKKEVQIAKTEHGNAELLPKVSAHIMRHTACTRMAEKRIDVKALQYIMGHTHIDVTMDVYNHVSEMSRIESEITRLESVAIS